MDGIQGKDISIWQDDNSTPQMFNFDTAVIKGVRFFGIKVSQANWVDQDFVFNWNNCKLRKFKRTGYHYLTWETSIEAQANTFMSALKNDVGEIYPTVDFERRSGVPSATIASEKLWEFIVRVEDALGRELMIYTGPSYWREFGSKDIKFKKKLWIANYGVLYPTVPEPFEDWLFWQYGEGKGTGLEFGAESLDLDQDLFNGDDAKFKAMFGSEMPQVYYLPPPPVELPEFAHKVLVDGLNIRTGPSTGYASIGKYYRGDIVQPLEINGTNAWIKTDKGYSAVTSNGIRYMELIKEE